MSLSSWQKLARLVKRNLGDARRGQRAPLQPRKSSPLWLELLEDRTLLSGTPPVYQWTGLSPSGTNWNDPANWSLVSGTLDPLNYPGAVGDIAQFNGTLAQGTVTVPSAITVGEIDFNTSTNITINSTGGGVLTLDNTGFAASAIISANINNTSTDTIQASLAAPNTPLAASIAGGLLQLNNTGVPANKFAIGSAFTAASGGTLSILAPNETGTAGLVANNAGTISISDGGGANLGSITLNGGIFSYTGASNVVASDTLGSLNVNSGTSTFFTAPGGAVGTVTLTFSQLLRQPGAVVNFTGPSNNGQNIIGGPTDQILFTNAPTTTGNSSHFHIGILPYAAVNGADFATYQFNNPNDPAITGIGTFNDYASSIGGAAPGDTVKETTPELLQTSATVNGIVLANSSASVAEAGNTLTLASGGILNTNILGGTIGGGTLTFGGSGEGILINGLVPGGLEANFFQVTGVSGNNNNAFGGNVLGTFGQINFNQPPTAQRVDPQINYITNANGVVGAGTVGAPLATLPAGLVQPSVGVQWTGDINVVKGGTYDIYEISTDDDSRLYIDGQLATEGTWQANQAFGVGYNGTVWASAFNFTPGLHTILCQYFNAGGTGGEVIDWSGPDTNNAIVPISGAVNLSSPGFVSPGIININSVIAGANSLTLSGGQVNIATANTYTGSTYLAGATLNVGNNASLGSTGTLSLTSGALEASAGVTLPNPVAFNNALVNLIGFQNLILTGNGTVTGSNTLIFNNTGQTNITGNLSGTGSLTLEQTGVTVLNNYAGDGALALSGANTFSGGTTLVSGGLVIGSSTVSNGSTTTSGPLGTGTFTWTGGTVLSDAAARTLSNPVVLNGSLALTASAFGGTSSSGSSLTFSGATVIPASTTLNISGTASFTGIVSGQGNLTVTGEGFLTLSGANTYSGGTTVNAGILGALGTLVLGNSAAFGTGPVTLTNGALQAGVANIIIGNALTFTDGSYIALGGNSPLTSNVLPLTFGTGATSTGTLNGAVNFLVNVPTTFNEVLSGNGDANTGINLDLFSGTSTLTLTQADTYTGSTVVNGGTLVLSGAAGSLTGTGGITINSAGTVTADNTHGNLIDRLNPGAPGGLTLNGGTLNLLGAPGAASMEAFSGTLLASGNSIISITAGTGSGSSVALSSSFLNRNPGGTASFQTGAAGQILGTTADQITFSASPPTLTNGIYPFATVTDATAFNGGFNLATYGANGIAALPASGYTTTLTGNPSTDANVNYLATSSKNLTASDTVNAILMVGNNVSVSGATGTTLTIGTGVVASSGNGDSLSVPVVAFPSSGAGAGIEGLVYTNGGSDTLSSVITGSGGLTIGGTGNLILPVPNSYTGGANSVQNLPMVGNAVSGTYSLNFDGATTGNIAPTATPAAVQTALQSLRTIGAGNVLVTGIPGGPYTVTFTGLLAGAIQPLMAAATNTMLDVNGNPVPLTITLQTIGASATSFNGGTLTLGTNNAIQQGLTITAGTIQATTSVTLAAATSLGAPTGLPGAVSGSADFTIGQGSSIAFTGGLVMNGPAATIVTSNTNPTIANGAISDGIVLGTSGSPTQSTTALIKQGTGTLILTSQNTYAGTTWVQAGIVNVENNNALGLTGDAVDYLVFGGTITGGTFTLTYNGATTAPIPWTVAGGNPLAGSSTFTGASTGTLQGYIQGQLDLLPTIGPGNVFVGGGTGFGPVQGAVQTTAQTTPLIFALAFTNELGNQVVPAVTVNYQGLTGTAPKISVQVVNPGNNATNVVVGTAGQPATVQFQGGDLNLGSTQLPNNTGTNILGSRFTVSGNGVGGIGALDNLNGNNVLSGSINLYGATSIGANFPLITQGSITGPGDLTKIGSGNLVFNSLNTYTGATNINAGILSPETFATALGSNVSPVVVQNGATLQLGPGNSISGKVLTLNGNGFGFQAQNGLFTSLGALDLSSPAGGATSGITNIVAVAQGSTWSGNIVLASNATIDAGFYNGAGGVFTSTQFPFILSGIISGPGGLTKVGSGELALWAGESYTGTTTVTQGTFALAQSGILAPTDTVNVQVGATFLMDNSIVNIPNRFTGSLVLSGGNFRLLGTNAVGVATNETLGTITLASGNSIFTSTTGTGGGNTTTITAAALIRQLGATAAFVAPTGSLAWGAGNQLFFTTAPKLIGKSGTNTDSVLPYAMVTVGAASSFATYAPAPMGLVPFTNVVTSLANVNPDGSSVVQLSAGATLSTNLTVNALLLSGTATLNLSAGGNNFNLNIGSGGLLTGGTTTITGGTLNLGSPASPEGIILGTANTTITSVIAGSGGLIDANSATLTLGAAGSNGNTYSGATTQNAGTLLIATPSSLSSGAVNLTAGSFGTTVASGNFALGNAINFNNSVVLLGASNAITFVGPINLTGSNNFTVSNAAIFAGVVTGTGSLNLIAGNSLVLSNALNTYSGGTFLGSSATQTGLGLGTVPLSNVTANLQIEASDTLNNAQQTLAFSGTTGGTFTLTFNSSPTAAITYSSTASTLANNIQAALAGLANIGGNTLNNSSSNVSVAVSGATATVIFLNSLGQTPQSALTANIASLVGTNPALAINPTAVVGGAIASGPLGTGTFFLFGNGTIFGTSGSNNGGNISVSNNNGNPTNSLVVTQVVVHNPVTMINSDFQFNGGFYNGGANMTLAGPVSVQGSSAIYVGASQQLTISGQISGDGSLNYFGAGDYNQVLYLTGNNTGWTGGFNFWTAATLKIGNSNALGTGVVNLNQGLIEDDGNGGSAGYVINNVVNIDNNGNDSRAFAVTTATSPLTLTGPITGPGGLTKYGPGNLIITNVDAHTGATTINQGTITLQAGGSILASSGIIINPGGALTLNNSTFLNANRVGDNIPITLAGGNFNYIGNNTPNTLSSETLGVVTLNAGQSNINSTLGTGAGDSNAININIINRAISTTGVGGGLLNFNGAGAPIGSATNQVIVQNLQTATVTAPAIGAAPVQVTNGYILPYASVTNSAVTGSLDFASVAGLTAPFSIAPFTGYTTPSGGLANAGSLDVVKITSNDTLSGSAAVAAVLISGDNITVGSSGSSLNLSTGAILATSGSVATPTKGIIVNAAINLITEGLIVSDTSAGLVLNGVVTSSSNGLTIGSAGAGTGSVTLSTANVLAGATNLDAGTLVLNNNAALGAVANTFTINGGGIQGGPSVAGGVVLANPITLAMGAGNGTGSDLNYQAFFNAPGAAAAFSGNSPLTLTGLISGTGGIAVNGGSLTFGGSVANTYVGTTTVNGGTLTLAATNAVTTVVGVLVINSGGTVVEAISNSQTGNATTTNCSVFLSGGGTLSLGSTVTAIRGLNFTNGGAITMTNGGQLFFNGGDTTVLSTNGLPSTATISGGTLGLSTANTRVITVANSGGTFSVPFQTITFTGSPTAGNFTLSFNGQTTTPITYSTVASALASNIQAALNALTGIGALGSVAVTAASAASATVSFVSVVPGTTLPSIGVNSVPVNAVQNLTFPGNPTTGSFILTYNGATTAPIPYSTTPTTLAANIQTALSTLSTLGNAVNAADTLTFAGGATGGTFTLTFNGQTTAPIPYGPDLPANIQIALLALSTINLGQNASNAVVTATNGTNRVDTLTFSGSPTGGTFALSFNGVTSSQISFSTNATTLGSNIQSALNSLATIGVANTSVSSNAAPTVTYQNVLGLAPLTGSTLSFVASDNFLTGGTSPSASVATTTAGVLPTTLKVAFQNGLGGQPQAPSLFSANVAGLTGGTSPSIAFASSTTGASSTNNVTAVSASSATSVNVTFQNNLGSGFVPLAIGPNGVGSNQVQEISLAGVTGGSFSLTVNGLTSAPIVYSATASTLASNIQSALTNSAVLGSGNASVSVSGNPQTAIVTFQGSLAGQVLGGITAVNVTPATGSVETVTLTGAPYTGGTFTLTMNGQTTAAINYTTTLGNSTTANTLAGNVQAALNALSTIGPGNSSVVANNAGLLTITFQGLLGGGVLQSNGSGNGTTTPAAANAVNAVQSIAFPAAAVSGQLFTLAFNKGGSQTTGQITFSTNAATLAGNIQSALASLSNIGGDKTNSSTSNVQVVVNTNPTIALVTFQNTLGGQSLTTMTASGTSASDVQTLNFSPTTTGGTFTLAFGASTSGAINYSTNPGTLQANIQTALNALSSVGTNNTLVSVNAAATSATVTFQNALGNALQPLLVATPSSTLAIAVVHTTSGLFGLTGGNPTVTTSTAGAGAVTAGTTLAGLLGGGGQGINVALVPGFGLNPSTAPVPAISSAIAGAVGGLSGGTANTITNTTTTTGFGLVGGTNPAVALGTASAGFAGDLNISSQIVPGPTAGAGLVKIGLGSLVYSGSAVNTYTGQTTVDQGSIIFDMQAANAFGYSGGLVVNAFAGADGVQVVSNFSQLNGANPVVINGALGKLDLSTYAAPPGGTSVGQTVGSLNINGGTVSLGNNTLALAGPLVGLPSNNQSATITDTSSAGQLILNSTQPISASDVSGVAGLNISAVISGSAGFNKQGTGTVILSNSSNNTYAGITSVNEGTLQLSPTGSVNAQQTLTFAGTPTGGTFTLSLGGATTSPISFPTNSSAATLAANVQAALDTLPTIGIGNTSVAVTNTSGPVLTITFQNQLANTNVATLGNPNSSFTGGSSPKVTVASSRTGVDVVSVPAAAGQLVSLNIGDFAGGSTSTKSDAVSETTSNAIAAGAGLIINNSGALNLNNNYQTINGASGGNSLTIVGGTVNTGTGVLTVGGPIAGQTNPANTTPATINGTLGLALSTTTSTQTLDVLAAPAGSLPAGVNADMVINGAILGPSNSVGLTKSDTGTLLLSGSNSYSGPTTVTGGTLLVDGSLNANAVQTIFFSGAPTGGTFTLTFNGSTTAPITYSSVATVLQTNIQTALNALTSLGATSSQVITFTGSPTGGTFMLSFGGSTTAAIAYSSVASTLQSNIQSALTALSSLTSATALSGTSVLFTFQGSLGGAAQPLIVAIPSLTGGTSPAITVSAAPASGGPYTVVSAASNAASATVTFTGVLGGAAQNTMTSSSSLTGGTSPIVQVVTTVNGSTSPVTVSGGTLGGVGTTGPVTVVSGGTVNPGDPITSAGVFTNNSAIGTAVTDDFSNGGNLTLIVAGYSNTPTQSYSQLKVGGLGILKLGGTSSITFNLSGVTGDGTASAMIQYNGVIGTFSSVNTVNNPLNLTPILFYKTNQIDVSFSGPATHFTVTSTPTSTVAGAPITVTVTALDQSNEPAFSYLGTVQFTTSDPAAKPPVVLPANYTFTAGDTGQHVFTGVILATAGVQSVTATDTTSSTITGSSAITITAGAATHFLVAGPQSIAAGHLLAFTVTALDQFNNTATSYTGTVHFSSSDPKAVLSDNNTLTAGVGSFGAILETAGNKTITATDLGNSSITGISNTISVIAGSLNHFAVSAPTSTAPGQAFTITVTAQDQFNNPVVGYTGTVHFSKTDTSAQSSVPADYTFVAADNGVHIFTNAVKLVSAPSQTVTASDSVQTSVTGAATVSVSVSTPSQFVISAPASTAAGSAIVFTVTAKDPFNNTAAAYTGTIHFTSSDPQAGLPADATLTNGVGFFAAVLKTAGSQTLTATDTSVSTITGTSTPIVVSGLAVNHIGLFAPAKAVTGISFPLTVAAQDQFGNVFTSYTGVVHFSSTDPNAALPANTTLTNGMATFSVTLKSPGTQTISANDTGNPNIVGTSNTISTLGLIVTSLTPTSTGFIAVFNKPFDPSQINLYDNSGANGPDDVLLTGPGASQTSTHGSLIIDPSNQTITFVKTSTFTTNVNAFNPQTGVLTAGTYTVTFRSAANGFVDSLGAPLDGTASGNPAGSNYTTTFVVAATPTLSVGIPGFARGPNSTATINLPNNLAFGIPLNLSTGAGVTAGKFTLQYNSALLSITGVTVNTVLTGATLTYDAASTPGSAVIDFSSPTALAAGPVRLGGLVATVPNSAAPLYTQKALLHWSSVSVNGGATAAVGDDAVDVNAYFGDANGDGTLSGGDASQISQVATGVNNNPATGTIGGFSAFRLADPVLIGDLTASGTVGAGAVTLMNSFLSGTPRAQIPTLPGGLTIPANGVDPALSIPTNLQATAGSTVVVPVQIDSARPQGSTGVTEAILAVQYDPAEFTVSAQDVQLGNLPLSGSGWQLQTAINSQTGQIGIDVFGTMPLQTPAGGTLVTISFHVRENAAAGSTGINLVPAVNPTGYRSFVTTVSDAQGAMVLHTAETALGSMPGAPGSIDVSSNALVIGPAIASVESETTVQSVAVSKDFGGSATVSATTIGNALPLGLMEQVFGDLQPMLAAQENTLGQPGVILGSPVEEQTGAGLSDAMVQRIGVAQHDWVPADMVAYLGQTAKAGRRSPFGEFADGALDQDGDEMAGVEAFFAREAAQHGS